jgi:DNA-binding transcriptional regulator YhcF (GntR family)
MKKKLPPSIPRKGGRKTKRQPLYEQVAQVLREEIVGKHQPGDKLESGPTLARRLGVSVLTVREAVNALTQEGLLNRERGSGTYVRQTAMKPVALVVGLEREDLRRSFFFFHVVRHIEECLHAANIPCRHYTAYLGKDAQGRQTINPTLLDDIRQRAISLALNVSFSPPPDFRKLLGDAGISQINTEGLIETDYDDMLKSAFGYLLAHGRRRLALVQWPSEDIRELFETLSRQAGIEPETSWMKGHLEWRDTAAPDAAFRQLWQDPEKRPDGLICLNDVILERMIPTMMNLVIHVPADLMVVTHSNKGSGIHYPFPVARMEVDPDVLAERLAELVKVVLAGKPAPSGPIRMTHRWIPEQAE